MTPERLPIDAAGHHRLVIERGSEGALVRLESDAAHHHSDLRWALLAHLSVSGVRLDPVTRSARIMGDRIEPRLGDRALTVLRPFETRFLADNLAPHAATGRTGPIPSLATDLHTHFAGCICADDLMEIGAAAGAVYPRWLLERAGIHAGADLEVSRMSPEIRARLAAGLAVPADRQLTFREMQSIYRLRQPITKMAATFLPMARRIALDYATMGVRYVELSLHQIAEAALLEAVHREMPRIEAETGVRMRFLAAFGRQDDHEWMLDYLDRVASIAESRYLAGIDVMGHEVNSTHEFAPILADFAKRIERVRSGFVIRVHAGENAAHPENVRVAAEAIRGAAVQLRIGHGLYGADAATLAVLEEVKAIVEFNLDSNFALNNLQTFAPEAAPLSRYLEARIPAVLGTDGYGVYQVTLEDEARAAMLCGLDEAGLERIRQAEDQYLAGREAAEGQLPRVFAVPADADPSGLRFGPAVEARKRARIEARDRALSDALLAIGAERVDRPAVDRLLRKKRAISFAGAWRESWARLTEEERAAIERVITELLAAWDPAGTVLLTGGTRHGVEAVVQRHGRARGFPVLGVLVNAIHPEDLEVGSITHALLIGETIYDKAGGLYRLIKDHDGWCLFFGGGPTVGDEIQTADNLHLPHLMMDGPGGASSLHARLQPERAFRTAAEVLGKMAAHRHAGGLRHLGPNPAVDVIAVRGGTQVLLVRRRDDARSFAGAWALPGGFVKSTALPRMPWVPGAETLREAAVREVREETGLESEERDGAARLRGRARGRRTGSARHGGVVGSIERVLRRGGRGAGGLTHRGRRRRG